MPSPRDTDTVLNRVFLDLRSRVLDIAAALDRIDRAPEAADHHPDRRVAQLRRAIQTLLEPGPDRAETVQQIFSLDYDPNWERPARQA